MCIQTKALDHLLLSDHRPAHWNLREIGALDYGVIRLLMRMLGGLVTTYKLTGPLSTSSTCEQRQAHLLLCPAICCYKNSLLIATPRGKIQGRQGLWAQRWTCWTYFEHVHRQRRNGRSLWRDNDNMVSGRRLKRVAEKQYETESDV